MFEKQKDDFKAALYGGGDYKLSKWVQNLYKNRALWERLGKAGQEKQFNKLLTQPTKIPDEVTSEGGLTFKNKTTTAKKPNQGRARGKTTTKPRSNRACSNQAEKDLDNEEEEDWNNGDEDQSNEENLSAKERLDIKIQALFTKNFKSSKKSKRKKKQQIDDSDDEEEATEKPLDSSINEKIKSTPKSKKTKGPKLSAYEKLRENNIADRKNKFKELNLTKKKTEVKLSKPKLAKTDDTRCKIDIQPKKQPKRGCKTDKVYDEDKSESKTNELDDSFDRMCK